MTQEELQKLAEKVRDDQATKEEKLNFFKAVNSLLQEMKDDLTTKE